MDNTRTFLKELVKIIGLIKKIIYFLVSNVFAFTFRYVEYRNAINSINVGKVLKILVGNWVFI